MQLQVLFIYGISALTIILGFVALLKQKTYVDPDTRKPTEIEIPIIGKMRTNYPALVFVFAGVALAVLAFNRSYPTPKEQWEITGSFKSNVDSNINWENGTIILFPIDFRTEISRKGNFRITAMIEQGLSFEDVIQSIDYSHVKGSVQIIPRNEFLAFKKEESSLVENATETGRKYKPIKIEEYQ